MKRRDSREAGNTDHHEYKINKIIVVLQCWAFSMTEMLWWSECVSESSREKSDFIWQMALLRHLLLYLEFPAHFVCDMKRINAFFFPKFLTSALHTGAIKGLCNAFCHCSFPEETLYPPHCLLSRILWGFSD